MAAQAIIPFGFQTWPHAGRIVLGNVVPSKDLFLVGSDSQGGPRAVLIDEVFAGEGPFGFIDHILAQTAEFGSLEVTDGITTSSIILNFGPQIFDTDLSHLVTFAVGSNVTADRTWTADFGNVDASFVGCLTAITASGTPTSGTGEDEMLSYALPSAFLNTAGKTIRVKVWGTIAGGGAHTMALRIRLDDSTTTTQIGTTAALTVSAATYFWTLEAEITTRSTGATGTICGYSSVAANTGTTGRSCITATNPTNTHDLTGVVTIEITGESSNAATTCTPYGMTVEAVK